MTASAREPPQRPREGSESDRNLTLSADERLIEEARERARREHTTLNEQFRRWLGDYAGPRDRVEQAMRTIEEVRRAVQLRGPFTRDELNER